MRHADGGPLGALEWVSPVFTRTSSLIASQRCCNAHGNLVFDLFPVAVTETPKLDLCVILATDRAFAKERSERDGYADARDVVACQSEVDVQQCFAWRRQSRRGRRSVDVSPFFFFCYFQFSLSVQVQD